MFVVGIFVRIFFSVIITLESAWIVESAWRWFIVPKFGVPLLSYGTVLSALLFAQACISGVYMHRAVSNGFKESESRIRQLNESEKLTRTFFIGLFTSAVALPFTWLAMRIWHIWV